MRKPNRAISLILGGVLLCTAILSAGCSKTSKIVVTPSMNYESTWSYDREAHFKKCLDKGDDSVIDYNEHYLDNEREDEDGYLYSDCAVCGYRRYSTPIEGKFELTKLEKTVYPYVEKAKTYLVGQSKEPDDYQVKDYSTGIMAPEGPITIGWTSDEKVDHFEVICSRNADFSNHAEEANKTYTIGKNERSVGIYNLYPNTKYHVKVTEVFMDQKAKAKELTTSFTTADIPTRAIHIDGVTNVRDLGGYPTSLVKDGNTKHGMIYRGSSFDVESYQIAITKAGETTLLKELGVKTEIELRDTGTYSSPVSSKLNYKQLPISVYNEVFSTNQQTSRDSYKQLMELLADESNYPVYIHCGLGDDRTGSFAFFLNALLGVEYNDLCIDYEMTSFSPSGLRGARNGQNYSNHFADIYSSTRSNDDGTTTYIGLQTFGEVDSDGAPTGKTSLADCAVNFFKSLGVSEDTIEAVRRINIEGYGAK